MKKTLLLALLLVAAPAFAGVTNNGDGTSTWWQCSSSTNTTDFDAAIQTFSEDQGSGFHAMAALTLRDNAVVTVGDGLADTTYCGVLQVGRSEWRITLGNTGLSDFRAAWNLRNGWVDDDPADNLDDNTGETANQFADRYMKAAFKDFTQRQHNLDKAGETPTQADDFTDDP